MKAHSLIICLLLSLLVTCSSKHRIGSIDFSGMVKSPNKTVSLTLEKTTREVTSEIVLELDLDKGGGAAVRFTPKNKIT